jgi:starvation-inducible outer membrane lipoprotein
MICPCKGKIIYGYQKEALMKKQIKLSVVMLLITAVFFMFTACKSSDKKIEGTETEGTTQVTTGTSSEGKDTEGFNYS